MSISQNCLISELQDPWEPDFFAIRFCLPNMPSIGNDSLAWEKTDTLSDGKNIYLVC